MSLRWFSVSVCLLPTSTSCYYVAASPLPFRVASPFAVADGVTDGARAYLAPRQPIVVRAAAPAAILGRKKTQEDPVTDVPPLEQHPGRKVALLVEPTPFTHVSGYSNRFKEMLRFLKAGGDDAEVITPDDSADRPDNFLDCPITYVPGFRLIFYKQVQLTLDIGFRALTRLRASRPTLVHAVAPGFFVLPAILYSRLLKIPLVISYHTHLPHYANRYVTVPGLRQLCVWMAERWHLVLNFAGGCGLEAWLADGAV